MFVRIWAPAFIFLSGYFRLHWFVFVGIVYVVSLTSSDVEEVSRFS